VAKTIHSLDEIRPNVFEALKRAYVKRGIIRAPKKLPQNTDSDLSEPTTLDGSEKTSDKPGMKVSSPDSKNAKGPETLTELTQNSQDILFEASTVWPFTLFPDTITLDREKLTIANRFFWRVANITSTPISEIMTCEANVGPFFGSIHLTFRFFADNQRGINFLSRDDATKFQRLLHGFIIAHRREIDTSNVNKEDLIKMLLELGQGASD
jgi:hypothetical protein